MKFGPLGVGDNHEMPGTMQSSEMTMWSPVKDHAVPKQRCLESVSRWWPVGTQEMTVPSPCNDIFNSTQIKSKIFLSHMKYIQMIKA